MKAGAAVRDFTPVTSQFLAGYPHVPRMSEGAHDPLLSSALYLEQDDTRLLMIANDILFVPTPLVDRARRTISDATGIPPSQILISATHTHSAPKVSEPLVPDPNPVAPPVDEAFLDQLTDAISEAGIAAARQSVEATLSFARADATGIGTNRHDPTGPSDHELPVLAARAVEDGRWLAIMLVCSMHPTVLHEDSRLVSADFPWAARQVLQEHLVGDECAVLHHMGCAGNQSSRHVTTANTFAEAERIGKILGAALLDACEDLVDEPDPILAVATRSIDPPRTVFPAVDLATQQLAAARARFAELQQSGPAAEARTAECDVFGAERRLQLANRAAAGQLEAVCDAATPVEVQVLRIGSHCYAAWSSETYVEYGLALKERCPDTYAITTANGQAPGYVTTPEAVAARFYEAGSALFTPATGDLYVETASQLVQQLRDTSPAPRPD